LQFNAISLTQLSTASLDILFKLFSNGFLLTAMGAYEIFKTAQVELCNTLSGELVGTNISTFSIGPGLVKTETAHRAIEKVSSLMGMTLDEFYEMNEKRILSAEEAGVGFALSIVNAESYSGRELSSIQALTDAGFCNGEAITESFDVSLNDIEKHSHHIKNIVCTFNEQYDGWLKRNVFERQWGLRDFKKTVGAAADIFQKEITSVLELIQKQEFEKIINYKQQFEKLKIYYSHQSKLLQGYEKDPVKLNENTRILHECISELQIVIDILS